MPPDTPPAHTPEQANAPEKADALEKAAVGMLLGCAVGDAVGELAFAQRERADLIAIAALMPVLRYTDDTAMTAVLAQSLIDHGDVVSDPLGAAFAAAYNAEPKRGYGPGPPRLFARVAASGLSYAEAAQELYDGHGSWGNGAAMRVAPVGLAYRDDPAALYAAACTSAAVTHAHPVGQDGAAVQARAVALATHAHLAGETLDPAAVAADLQGFARTEVIADKMACVAALLDAGAEAGTVADAVGRSVAVEESMPFAVYAFLASPEDSLKTLYTAVLNGGDRDTLGAMAGAISGAYLGPEGLRKALTKRVENRETLIGLGQKLAAAFPAMPPRPGGPDGAGAG